ncbi:MAG TPA: CoA-binding protein, partial [Stellaceae bacterium]|nr:CoA-binding protein [Stellaceae bacterium]
MTETSTLRAALDPRSIAVIGASENPNKIGGRPIHYLARFGFKGAIYPINPHRAELQGHKSYPDLASLPEAPELAIVAVPGQAAVAAVTACSERGVKVAVVMASGFGETGAEGEAQERAMVATARAHSMRIVGPNTQGLANFGTGAIANFSTMFLESPPEDGPVAIVSQSGAMSVVPYGLLRARGIGVRHTHATGNDADVTAPELARAVLEDPEVRLLLLYLESIADADELAEVAEAARRREVPVVALKA